jgi:hypothetical protein
VRSWLSAAQAAVAKNARMRRRMSIRRARRVPGLRHGRGVRPGPDHRDGRARRTPPPPSPRGRHAAHRNEPRNIGSLAGTKSCSGEDPQRSSRTDGARACRRAELRGNPRRRGRRRDVRSHVDSLRRRARRRTRRRRSPLSRGWSRVERGDWRRGSFVGLFELRVSPRVLDEENCGGVGGRMTGQVRRHWRLLPYMMLAVLAFVGHAGGCSSSVSGCPGGASCGGICCSGGLACCDGKMCVPQGAFCCGNGSGGVCPNGYSCCPGGCCRGSGSGSGSSGSGTGGGGGGSCTADHYAAACPDGTTQCCSVNMVCCHDSANGGAIGCEFQGFCE